MYKFINVLMLIIECFESLYANVSSCIKLNRYFAYLFKVNIGLGQGCTGSPELFNRFINNLAMRIKAFGLCIKLGNDLTIFHLAKVV